MLKGATSEMRAILIKTGLPGHGEERQGIVRALSIAFWISGLRAEFATKMKQ